MHTYIKANGSLVACCESQEFVLDNSEPSFRSRWTSNHYQKLRRQIMAGERPEACRKCWANEDLGLTSNRQEMLENLNSGFFGDEVTTLDFENELTQLPTSIEVKLSNVCNLKCRMCHPSSSHRLWEDRDIHEAHRGPLKWNPRVQTSDQTMNQLYQAGPDFFSNLRVIQFSGGEPLISDEHLNILEKLLSHDPQKCQVRYSTNLQQLSHRSINFLDMWQPFKKVNIKVSIDGLGDVYDYIRVGGSFQRLMENFRSLIALQRPNIELAIGFTTQAYNVFQLAEFLTFFEQYIPRSQISTHWLHSPKILSVSALPQKLRAQMAARMKQTRDDLDATASLLEELPDQPKLWQRFLKYTHELDRRHSPPHSFENLLLRHEYEL